ncbi:DNA topoisomerase III [Kushneria marisflavi]|uniref:DNA topoisomerase n=1 Tax=Kushneria marisflavi TaxID=157779 RepID=A0A240UL57_9GAMM|nr:DNA topoisomerase III [Kushneria marisflavi]ART61772.1 DNA topoisomerase III [Kushneria marisflavi]RKD86802.1 DNA topoisomerase-3 [Kushneria marisflavi]
MQLIIAEKPSLGRAIASALPGRFSQSEGALSSAEITVSWCFGHLLEQAAPEAYDERLKRWRLDDLPIIPSQWKLVPRQKARGQLAILRRLIKSANRVIHAGDPDREGQLLVQETIEYLGWKGPVERLLISDMNTPAVKRAWQTLEDNARFQPLYQAALTRSRADWLYGINLTRAWTVTGQQAGLKGVLSIGRVQTPLLGLIVRRDRTIEDFQPVDFYPLWADFDTRQGTVRAWWQPSDQHRQDDQGRLLDAEPARALAAKLPGQSALIQAVEQKHQRQSAPLPYSLSTLQIDAARRYKMSAQSVLDCAQRLYERYRLITYPRSDCRYLPRDYLKGVGATLQNACQGDDTLKQWQAGIDTTRVSRAFNDKKIGAHHAIAPTGQIPHWQALSRDEQNVYTLVVRNVLAQFYPSFEYRDTRVTLVALEERFMTKGREILQPGWRVLFNTPDEEATLPAMTQGDKARVIQCEVQTRQTRPPEPFTDASLINAMTHVARYVTDNTVRATLKETDGLGTEATRASMIETLLSRDYVYRQSGTIRATRRGRGLIDALPESLSGPERTALWEQRLSRVREGNDSLAAFLEDMAGELKTLVGDVDAARLARAMQQAGGEQPQAATDRKKTTRRGKSNRQPPSGSRKRTGRSSSKGRSTS